MSGSRGRPRRPETDDRIAQSALAILREHGPAAVNVASVSARSGVARTTIYRRYRDRAELLRAALAPVTATGEPPDGVPVREKLGWVLARVAEVVTTGVGPGGVAAVLTEVDPEFSDALRDSLEAALEPLRRQVAADVEAGVLAGHVDPDVLLDLLLGSYLAALVRHDSLPEGWLERTADLLAASLVPEGSASAS